MIPLATATFLEPAWGTEKVAKAFYHSWWLMGLWAVVSIISLYLIIRNFNRDNSIFCLLHLALIIILAGAFITHSFSISQDVHLRLKEPCTGLHNQPLTLELRNFDIDYYPLTMTPQNYHCTLSISHKNKVETGTIYVNSPLIIGKYRIFLSSYDIDKQGVSLIVTSDRYGTFITYIGYFLFFFCSLILVIQRLVSKSVISKIK
jgi:hypothetical protein